MTERASLSIPVFDEMDDFAPRRAVPEQPRKPDPEPSASISARAGQGGDRASGKQAGLRAAQPPRAAETRRAIDAVSQFPSREGPSDGQLNLKGPNHVLDRFRALCKADRRSYYDMLEILMDRFEERHGQG